MRFEGLSYSGFADQQLETRTQERQRLEVDLARYGFALSSQLART